MRFLLLVTYVCVFSYIFSGCIHNNHAHNINHVEVSGKPLINEYYARITYYTDDRVYGSRVASPSVKRAIRGTTVAAHPDFEFGTAIKIPALKKIFGDDRFIVQDRGSAVTKKSASNGRGYVFDVYVSSHSEVRRLANSMPMWTKVYVIEDQ